MITLNYNEIIELIPHRYPFLFIDKVEDIIENGYLELFTEPNWRIFSVCREDLENFADIPASERVKRTKITIENPEEFEEFLETPLTAHLDVRVRQKLRALMSKLNF